MQKPLDGRKVSTIPEIPFVRPNKRLGSGGMGPMGLSTLLSLNAGSHLSGGTEIHYTLVLHVLKFMRTHKSTTRQPHHTGDDSIVPPNFPTNGRNLR